MCGKARATTASTPTQASSAAAFEAAYGETGATGASSGVGHDLGAAVDVAARGEQQPGRRGLGSQRLDHVHRPEHVRPPDLGRIAERLPDRRGGGEVHDRVAAADGRGQRTGVEHVALVGDERLAELGAQVAADEPRRAGDEDALQLSRRRGRSAPRARS